MSSDYPFDLERNSVQALAGVLDAAMVRYKQTPLKAWKTVTRLLRDLVDDGYNPYVLALALDKLVSKTSGDVIPAQVCSIPAMVAGMSMSSTPSWIAKYVYWRRFVPAEGIPRYEYYRTLALDARRLGDKDLERYALERLEKHIRDSR